MSLTDVQRFRRSFRGLAGSVSIVLASDGSGGVRGVTCTSAVSLSLDPPMVVVCFDDSTRMKELLELATTFSINFLASSYEPVARAFASGGQILKIAPQIVSGRTGVPTLSSGTVSVLECRVAGIHPGGDHWIVSAHVQHSRFQADQDPLLYRAGRFGVFSLPSETSPGHAQPIGRPK